MVHSTHRQDAGGETNGLTVPEDFFVGGLSRVSTRSTFGRG